MPLKSGKTNMGYNIAELENAGYPAKQAIAIAYKKAGGDDDTRREDDDTKTAREYDLNGWPEIKGNPISKVGVFEYLGSQISPELEPDRIYSVYRPEEELSNPETIDSFKLLPWTDEHAMLGNDDESLTPAEKKGIHGVIGEDVYFDDGYLKANLKVFSNKLADLIEQGKKELSIGYRCLYELKNGTFKGQRYDAIQRNIRGNHIALVDEGRSGHDVSVLDCFKITLDTKELKMSVEEQLAQCLGRIEELENKIAGMSKDEENPELTKKAAEEGDEAGEPWNEEIDEADPAMFVTQAKLNEDEENSEEVIKKEEAEEKPGDLKKPVDKSMDTKSILREISQRDILARKLAPFIGTFDHSEKTLKEVAEYGVRKLGIKCARGLETAVLQGYLVGAKPVTFNAVSQDSHTHSTCVDKYLAGVN